MVIKIENAPKIKHISIDITFDDESDNQEIQVIQDVKTSNTYNQTIQTNKNNKNQISQTNKNQTINNKPKIPDENKKPKNVIIQEEF